jgi:hypothetical protein
MGRALAWLLLCLVVSSLPFSIWRSYKNHRRVPNQLRDGSPVYTTNLYRAKRTLKNFRKYGPGPLLYLPLDAIIKQDPSTYHPGYWTKGGQWVPGYRTSGDHWVYAYSGGYGGTLYKFYVANLIKEGLNTELNRWWDSLTPWQRSVGNEKVRVSQAQQSTGMKPWITPANLAPLLVPAQVQTVLMAPAVEPPVPCPWCNAPNPCLAHTCERCGGPLNVSLSGR